MEKAKRSIDLPKVKDASKPNLYDRFGTDTNQRGAEVAVCDPSPIKASTQGISSTSAASLYDCDDVSGATRRWSANDTLFWGSKQTYDTLIPGMYRCLVLDGIGPALDRQTVKTDKLIVFPDSVSQEVIEEVKKFWASKAEFDKRGFLFKRGVMMWGDPASGKTSTIQLIIHQLAELGAIVVFIDNPSTATACLQMIRKIEPDRPIIALMEDMDDLIRNWGEANYLALMDGETQIDNVVFLATTNYPERIDKRFIDRPSRFDHIVFVGMPNADARRKYFEVKEPDMSEDEREKWVELSKGFSIAHLKEMIIAVKCLGNPLDKVVDRLEAMRARKTTSDDAVETKSGLGFFSDNDNRLD
jgi:hypothetical protein